MNRIEIEEKVTDFLINELEIDEANIFPEAKLKEDMGIDSLDFVDIVVIVEKNFGFKIKAGVYVKTKWAVTIGYQLGLVNICNDKYFKEIIPGYYNDRVIVNAPSVKNSNIFATYSYYW